MRAQVSGAALIYRAMEHAQQTRMTESLERAVAALEIAADRIEAALAALEVPPARARESDRAPAGATRQAVPALPAS